MKMKTLPLLALLLLGACAPVVRSYRVANYEVRIYRGQAEMEKEMPQAAFIACKLTHRVCEGVFDRREGVIYTKDEAELILHEIKHALEPDWRHGPDCPRPDRCLK